MRTLLAVLLLVGCSGDTPVTGDAAIDTLPADIFSFDEPGIPMTLTSPTITDGGTIPLTHVCAGKGGQNQSPELIIHDAPAGTQSFAIVLTDLTISTQLVHCAIYDIPASVTTVPANVDKTYAPTAVPGAHQTQSYQTSVVGYNGPCPGTPHMYQFKVYALATATLPDSMQSTTKEMVVSTASASNLGTATLTATFTP